MIYDALEQIPQYLGLTPNLDTAIHYLTSHKLEELPLGRTAIAGEDVYLMVSQVDYQPASEAKYEAHRHYADIQLSLTGDESIGYLPYKAIQTWGDYQPDCQFAKETPEGIELPMVKDCFAIFFPGDAHRPGVGTGAGKKVVVKVRLHP